MIKIGSIGASGRIEAYTYKLDTQGRQIRTSPVRKQDNIVTTIGLAALKPTKDLVLGIGALSNVISIGTGTQVEHESVTGLAAFARKATGTRTTVSTTDFDNFEGSGRDLRVRTYRVSYQFAPDGVSRIYTEICLGNGDSGGAQTYALFRDVDGDPAGITVTADEYFSITYTYQVQAYRLNGFRTTMNLSGSADDYVALLPKDNKTIPLGPFPVTGPGVQEGTEAYVYLATGIPINSSGNKSGVSYTTDPDFDWGSFSQVLPTLQFEGTSSFNAPSWTREVSANSNYASDTSGPIYLLHDYLTKEGLPLSRRDFPDITTGPQEIAPGAISSATAYVCMWGSNVRGALVMLTKPIKVEPDEAFIIDELTGLAWEVNDPVNVPWVDTTQ